MNGPCLPAPLPGAALAPGERADDSEIAREKRVRNEGFFCGLKKTELDLVLHFWVSTRGPHASHRFRRDPQGI